MPLTTSTRPPRGAQAWVDLLKTLADPIRLRMVRLLEQTAHQGLSVGELADVLKLPQSTVSRHLKTLVEAGLAAVKRDGTSMFYRLADTAGESAVRQLRQLTREQLEADPMARADAQRLAHVLRRRTEGAEKFFGKAAPQWDTLRARWFGETFHLEALLALLDPRWVLGDLGTGTGFLLPLLAPHVAGVIAVDPSAAMLRAAHSRAQNLPNVTVRAGTLEDLPIESGTLDVALVALVFHHVVDPVLALKEIRRVLKPGGLLLIVDLQPHSVELFRTQMHHRWMGFSQEQLAGWLSEAGFVASRWHALPAQTGRSKENATPVPDLFVLRAEAPA